MNEIDQLHQRAVEELANELLDLPPHELLDWPDYGMLTRMAGGAEVAIAFWHVAFSDEKHHLALTASRRLRFGFYRKYISGVVFGVGVEPRLMTVEEAGDYD